MSVATSPVALLEPSVPAPPPVETVDMQAALLLAAIDNFTVGLIIVAPDGTILHQNKHAKVLLKQLPASSSHPLPATLWRCCHSLLQNQEEHGEIFADSSVVLEDEVVTDAGTIHVRTQWFDWDNSTYASTDCFLITLEDRQQSLTVMAQQEAQRYGLTGRETDVWLLKRKEKTYKEMAEALFISENTVKKHLKNIYAKKEQSETLLALRDRN